MKLRIVLGLIALSGLNTVKSQARKWEGKWAGQIEVEGVPLRIMFNIFSVEGDYRSKMDVPAQHVKEMTVSSTIIKGNDLELNLDKLDGQYKGSRIDSHSVKGIWVQRGQILSYDFNQGLGAMAKTQTSNAQIPIHILV